MKERDRFWIFFSIYFTVRERVFIPVFVRNKRIIGLIMLILLYSVCLCNFTRAEILQATLSECTGYVGIDMKIGAAPVPIINQVFKNSPALRAGLQQGDRIVAIDNRPTKGLSKHQIDIAISDKPGDKVNFRVIRANKLYEITVEVAPLSNTDNYTQAMYFED